MTPINDPDRLRARRLGTQEFIGYFHTKVYFQLVDDSGNRSDIYTATGGKGKGRGGTAIAAQLVSGHRLTENDDQWFIGHLWCEQLQNMVSLWDNPILENRGWTESHTSEADFPATMVFVKYVVMSTPLRGPDLRVMHDDDGVAQFLHLANPADRPIVVATDLEAALGESDERPIYKMQQEEVPLYPFDPETYSFLETDPVTGATASPRAYLLRLGPAGEEEYTEAVNISRLDPVSGSFARLV